MKKIVYISTLFLVLLFTSSWKVKDTKQNNSSLQGDPFQEAIYIVRMNGPEEMTCLSGGQSQCPVYWFLEQK